MADWFKMTAALIAVGFQLSIFSTAMCELQGGDDNEVQALIISGFVAYVFAFMLILSDQFGGFNRHRASSAFIIIFALAAAVLPMAGLGIYLDEHNSKAEGKERYNVTIMCGAAIMALLGGIFALLGALGC